MSYRRISILVSLLIFVSVSLHLRQVSAGDEWQPITQEELKMTSVPEAPGASAVILYRQVDRDDTGHTPHEFNYERIKILTEEGRKYGDIEIPFVKQSGNIIGIKARTVRPDGTIVNFEGRAFDKTIVKARGLKYLAKTFTLPDVQVGSIIEYHYTLDLPEPRQYPVIFEGPSRDIDMFEITLPAGYEVDDLPPAVNADYGFASYHSKTEVDGNVLRYTRTFEEKDPSVPLNKVADLKKLYRIIANDERNTAVLKPKA